MRPVPCPRLYPSRIRLFGRICRCGSRSLKEWRPYGRNTAPRACRIQCTRGSFRQLWELVVRHPRPAAVPWVKDEGCDRVDPVVIVTREGAQSESLIIRIFGYQLEM